jgi:hypothetical protein
MPPELLVRQANDDESTVTLPKEPADVFALGTLIHEVLSRIVYTNSKDLTHR